MTDLTAPKSICILRLSAIGDVCHAVASVQAIQAQWPNTKITWIIGKIEAQLVSELAGIEFIIFDKKTGLKAYRKLYRQLKDTHFDILLHMQTAIRASLATLCIKATQKWGFDRARAREGQWLFTNQQIAPQKNPHVAEGFWGFVKAIGATQAHSPTWQMPVDKAALSWCKNQLEGKRPYIVIAPSASRQQRNWLTDRYAALADHASQHNFQVILSGGPTSSEKKLGNEIAKACQNTVINLIGKTSLPQLLALLSEAELVIAPDSGPAHMATIVNTPVIGLYAHSNPKRTGPYHSFNTTLSVYPQILFDQTGKSVSENPWGKRVKGYHLMSLISVESVIAAFDRCLNNKSA